MGHFEASRTLKVMMPNAFVDTSVVIATCSRVSMLEDMLGTLLPQMAVLPFSTELVIVNDGSTDGTAELLREVQERSPVPVKVVLGHRRGIAAARNLGLEHARGTWIASCDDDQLADVQWLQCLRAAADEQSASFVGGSMELAMPMGYTLDAYGPRAMRLLGHCAGRGERARALPRGIRPATNNVLMRASAVRGLGGFDQQFAQGGEDADLFARAEEAGYTLWFEPRARMQHVMTPGRLSENGLHWTAMRIGSGDARMLQHVHPFTGPLRRAAVRVAVSALRDLPLLVFSQLRGNYRGVLDARCSLWYSKGLLRAIPALLFPEWQKQSAFLQQLDFRRRNGERTA